MKIDQIFIIKEIDIMKIYIKKNIFVIILKEKYFISFLIVNGYF